MILCSRFWQWMVWRKHPAIPAVRVMIRYVMAIHLPSGGYVMGVDANYLDTCSYTIKREAVGLTVMIMRNTEKWQF